MKNLIIIGARNYGREIYHFALECIGYKNDFIIKGFLDDNPDALIQKNIFPPILGAVEDYEIQDGDVFVCALGNPGYKKKYVELIENKQGKFYSLIHPSVIRYSDGQIGDGVIINAYTIISSNVSIGNHVNIHPFTNIGHDAKVGDFAVIGSHVFLGGFVEVGECTTVHPGAKVLPNIKIGNNAVVGTGSIVIQQIAAGVSVFGNPAREI